MIIAMYHADRVNLAQLKTSVNDPNQWLDTDSCYMVNKFEIGSSYSKVYLVNITNSFNCLWFDFFEQFSPIQREIDRLENPL